ncbi:P-loop containing nucleoside triphosphate hydrolase protein [Suillus bovinus]|uniref:P-loop containing nucleoside triphosphate hydrolase protein n=1 Tax=Suillus bovinus TaxID=48563 RepID=UPI001B87520F|nr:P-loop containing nucleoside triphosphate hydrolase protein [Suillus bovinus]KAG2151638.1 P-loop containing nucleoside triphosphate hydrolase protein [Suillus bovinus]
MNRQAQLEKRFNDILQGRVTADARSYAHFLEAICAQQDPATCINKIVESPHGSSAVQAAMRHNTTSQFLNGSATTLLLYLFRATDLGDVLDHLLTAIVNPPIFWTAFTQAFDQGNLNEPAQEAFAVLLLRLMNLTTGNTSSYRDLAKKSSILTRLLDSPQWTVKDIGYRIQHILSTFTSGTPVAAVGGPGGRHDNDFNDFREISILPTADEILCQQLPFIRPSSVLEDPDGEATRTADYLDNTFRLLREDMLYEIKEELQTATGQKKGRHRGLTIDGVTLDGVYSGTDDKKTRWGIKLKCKDDFKSMKNVPDKQRKTHLEKDPAGVRILKNQSLVCILSGNKIISLASVHRVEALLAQKPPVIVLQLEGEASIRKTLLQLQSSNAIRLIQIDTALFSFEPVLKALQKTQVIPLSEELLFWKDGNTIGSAAVTAAHVTRPLAMNPSVDLKPLLGLSSSIVLDKSQAASLLAGLTQRLSIIQGPPGTGKSFIGALLAKAIHDHTEQKILVVCYTNHALDQFLEDLMKIGIPDINMVRLGGRPNAQVAHLGIAGQKKERFIRSKADWTIIDDLKKSSTFHCKALETCHGQIQFEEPTYFDAFHVPEYDASGMTRVGKDGKPVDAEELIVRWDRGFDAGQFKSEPNVREAQDIWKMPKDARRDVIERWKLEIRKLILEEIHTLGTNYNECQDQLTRKFGEARVATLMGKRIIGCTTTGAAMFAQDIRAVNPDVLLVEEAGEILESHVLTAMGQSTNQMILIGDHKQLRPKVNNYKLTVEKGDGFELNRSLFERLVLKGFPHETLTAQHRMRPEISAFIRKITYPDLTDAPKTQGRNNIRGIQNDVIFIDHTHPEDDDSRISDRGDEASSGSKQNTYEVEMVWKIVRYLAQQGYGTEKLVVLTPYLGQLSRLRDVLKRDNDPVLNDLDSHDLIRAGLMSSADKTPKKRIRLATIDNYQGEESDIVIASLTRSNKANDIGFMNSPERLNVLISRARNGLILIGNSQTFMNARKGKELWGKFFELVKKGDHMYEGFPIKCERHPDRTVLIKFASEFDTLCPDGGCTEICNTMLNCGIHPCPLKCHQISDHSQMPCQHPYSDTCPVNHKLKWKCHESKPDPCPVCVKETERAEEKRKRELELKQKLEEEELQRQIQREQEQLEHDLQMAELNAKFKAEMDAIADAQVAQQRANAMKQKIQDIEAARANAQKAAAVAQAHADAARSASSSRTTNPIPPTPSSNPQSNVPPPNPTPPSSPSPNPPPKTKPPTTQTPSNPQQPKHQQPKPSSTSPMNAVPTSAAHQDWLHQKQVNGEKNSAIDGIMELTGLEDVKAQVLRIKAHIDLMKRQGVPLNKERLNLVLLGNPGTGKTTVARLYAQFLESVQVLPGDAFLETTGSSLAHEGVGGAKKLIEDAMKVGGGAIFIDEAYQLISEHQHTGGQVLDFLLAEMENRVGTLVFILAGYSKQMEKFFEHNPGLPSRVPYSLKFADYTDAELLTMLEALIEKRYSGQMKVEDGIRGLYARIAVRRLGRGRGREGFGNARALQNMFAKVAQRLAERLKKQSQQGWITDDFLITKEDFIGPDPSQVLPQCAPWEKLQKMIGLDSVKDSVRNFFDIVDTNYHRELQEKEPLAMSLNRVFLGSPGTGKTTVAKLYGQILAELGLLSNSEVVVKNPSDFVGAYLGHTEKNTKAILDSTVGKVLVIDEAYMLYSKNSGSQDQFKATVIDTLVAEIQSVPGEDRCVLLLGYKEQMEEMFQNVNPGLARRFAIENAFTFEDFTESQLRDILDFKLKDQDLEATDSAKQVASDLLNRAKNRPNFGNAGEVENMLGLAKSRYQKRQASIPPDQRSDVIFEPQDFDPDWDRDRNAAANLTKLFEDLVGCDDIVTKLGNYQKIARAMKATGVDMRKQIPTSFIFKGPPGTGKTTIARKFGQVYYDMGFLSSSDLIECSASDLVGQYVGHTGPKTKKLFEKALGKVLFVDEAYRLSNGHFAQEAIDEVVGLMTNEKFMNKMVIVLAGYEKEMNTLLSVNPGLASRFSEEITLTNMTAAKCLQVLDKELQKTQIVLSELADTTSSAYSEMETIVDRMSRLSNWGNARDVKTIAQRLVHHAFNAVANTPGSNPSLTADEAIAIMKDLLNQQRQRLNIPRITTSSPSGKLPMASSSNSAPPPPPSQSGSSFATKGSRPPKPPSQKSSSSNQSPPKPPPKSGPSSTPGGSHSPNKPPPRPSAPSSTSRPKVPPPPSSTPSSAAQVTPKTTPRRPRQPRGSQQASPASSSSRSLPPFSISGAQTASPILSQGSIPPIPDQRRKNMQLPVQSAPQPQSTNDVQRDPGVADAVWKRLEADKAAAQEAKRKAIEEIKRRDAELSRAAQRQQAAEAAARALAQQKARDQAEQEELRRQQEAIRIQEAEAKAARERAAVALCQMRLEQERKKREEEKIQQKLRNLGVCVRGYQWIKQPSGYRCAGGSHFIHDSQLR